MFNYCFIRVTTCGYLSCSLSAGLGDCLYYPTLSDQISDDGDAYTIYYVDGFNRRILQANIKVQQNVMRDVSGLKTTSDSSFTPGLLFDFEIN